MKKIMIILALFSATSLYSMENSTKKHHMNSVSQNYLLAMLLDAFAEKHYSTVKDIFEYLLPDAFDINLPLTHKKWKGRIIFNIIHNKLVRLNNFYYPLEKQEECFMEYYDFYDFFCERYKDSINVNIKDINSDRNVNDGWVCENDKTPLMYIVDQLFDCKKSFCPLQNILIDFLQRFKTSINPFICNSKNQNIFDICTAHPDDTETILRKKAYVSDRLHVMLAKGFTKHQQVEPLINCHFRFVTNN